MTEEWKTDSHAKTRLYRNNTLLEKLEEHSVNGWYPMHMPGHKRNTDLLGDKIPYDIDVTEIPGFDNLHDAHGIIAEGEQRIADSFGAKQTFYLINGSTCGILAGIRTATWPGDEIIVARNCHKSVYNAIEICNLRPTYLLPRVDEDFHIYGSIAVEDVVAAIEAHPKAKLVLITSPTFEGVVSDVRKIADICHAHDMVLMVDEAHGAHFHYSDAFPEDAVSCGADIVIESLHKTLPSLTSTSLAHISHRIDGVEMARNLSIFETTSPSYLLMASIDSCFALLEEQGDTLFEKFVDNLAYFSERCKSLHILRVLCHGDDTIENHPTAFAIDRSKIVISCKDTVMSGMELMTILREHYDIEMEMGFGDYVMGIATIADEREGFARLADALIAIDRTVPKIDVPDEEVFPRVPEYHCQIQTALYSPQHVTALKESVDCIAAEYAWAYPPGIPIITPGEVISKEVISQIESLEKQGVHVKSNIGRLPEAIRVMTDI